MSVYRSNNDKVIAGVCGGIAEYLGWSPFRVRLVWVLGTLFTAFAGLLLYLALWFLMPRAPESLEGAVLPPGKSENE